MEGIRFLNSERGKEGELRRSLHDRILIVINYITALVAMTSACMLDSDSFAPMVILLVCVLWFILFAAANGYIGGFDE